MVDPDRRRPTAICQAAAYGHGKLEIKQNFKLLALKVAAVAYKNSKYSDLTWKRLRFWKAGR